MKKTKPPKETDFAALTATHRQASLLYQNKVLAYAGFKPIINVKEGCWEGIK